MDAATSEPAGKAMFAHVDLDEPIVRGAQKIEKITLRKPKSGELRGLTLVDITQCDVTSIIKLLPRISSPSVTELEAADMDPADLLACAAEVSGFFLQRHQRPASLET